MPDPPAREPSSRGGGATARRWRFASCELDERTLELKVGDRLVELEPKPLQVLMYLLAHANEVVTKDELQDAVWPGRILSETVLTKSISRLRDALHDEQQTIIKTVHGYGYRLIAEVQVEAALTPPPPQLGFQQGDAPPLRPLWSLERRLGTGGRGEAWLARHAKTNEARVFKFALGPAMLTALKREITLFRLLHDALGDRDDLVAILDWNLEEPPYFFEAEYGGINLLEWAEAHGGLAEIPIAERLDIVASIADTLAAAHGVGVIHKDLKPANVLIQDFPDGRRGVKLGDFGSGDILDPGRIERFGITLLGFTQLVSTGSEGTPHYLAPEVLAGQPATVKADIYALGVLLYQLLVGDLRRPLTAGWEDDIVDPLLREDIAHAAAGRPERRLGEAAQLAVRLRSLDDRRRQWAAEEMARKQAQKARLEMERIRMRQTWATLAVAALAVGLLTSGVLYVDARSARNAAAEAAATSQAVSQFLTRDLFASIDEDQQPVRDLTVQQLLNRAADRVEQRFLGQAAVAAELHASLGIAYATLLDNDNAVAQLEKAMVLAATRSGPASELELEAIARLIYPKYSIGGLEEALPLYEERLQQGIQRLGRQNEKVLLLRQDLASGHYLLGQWSRAADELQALLADVPATLSADALFMGRSEMLLGLALRFLGEFKTAERHQRAALHRVLTRFGAQHLRVGVARRNLADVLIDLERYDEAARELEAARVPTESWVENVAGTALSYEVVMARLLLERGRSREALARIKRALDLLPGSPNESQAYWFHHLEALAQQRLGDLAAAEVAIRLALDQATWFLPSRHPFLLAFRIRLAEILIARDKLRDARQQLQGLEERLVTLLPAGHPYLGELRRVEALLWTQEGDADGARLAFEQALQITEARYGAAHWRSERLRKELAGPHRQQARS